MGFKVEAIVSPPEQIDEIIKTRYTQVLEHQWLT